ncbi:hypothetical protein [Parapedobacter sp. DT-150]|uniref:hypothetical protein n=1 Tax=Parapedobacter sp. DT-150 TaxID=3396162 RepID=UPI003F1CEFB6
MKYTLVHFKLSLLVALLICIKTVQSQDTDIQVETKVWEAMGGKANWQLARYFMFSCVGGDDHSFIRGERTYLWDRQTGNCRFEGVTTVDEALIVLFNIKTAKGTVYVNGAPSSSPQTAADIIKEVTAEFERDAYLLFLPTVLEGDNVTYAVEGEKLIGSNQFTVINVKNNRTAFEAAVEGQLFIDTQTGKIQEWKSNPDSAHFSVSGFKDIGGGLVLPTRFVGSDTTQSITYPLAAALVNIEAQKFNKP